eukprot:m.137866 g.137866  ORF g.137866 m.137866 type:complete len:234 (-) comp17584_c0_seq2:699-1400(-)
MSKPCCHCIIPLGLRCTTADLVKAYNLRRFALPFDWVFGSIDMIQHCMSDNFNLYLDSKQYYCVGSKGENALVGHRRYSKMIAPISRSVFNHHDPMSTSGHVYLTRTVLRLQVILAMNDRKKLLLLCCIDSHMWRQDLLWALFEELRAKTTNFYFVAIHCRQEIGDAARHSQPRLLVQTTDAGRCAQMAIYELDCIGKNTGAHFKNVEDTKRLAALVTESFDFDIMDDPLLGS